MVEYAEEGLGKNHTDQKTPNQIYAIGYRPDGLQFATAGKDCVVRVYDEATKTEVATLDKGIHVSCIGHANRVFSVKYHPEDPNILLSGGWDNNLLKWDLRARSPVQTAYGPHIAGTALDIQNDTIVTGSWRAVDSMQTFDLATLEMLASTGGANTKYSSIYTAAFIGSYAGEGIFGVGGTNSNCYLCCVNKRLIPKSARWSVS